MHVGMAPAQSASQLLTNDPCKICAIFYTIKGNMNDDGASWIDQVTARDNAFYMNYACLYWLQHECESKRPTRVELESMQPVVLGSKPQTEWRQDRTYPGFYRKTYPNVTHRLWSCKRIYGRQTGIAGIDIFPKSSRSSDTILKSTWLRDSQSLS